MDMNDFGYYSTQGVIIVMIIFTIGGFIYVYNGWDDKEECREYIEIREELRCCSLKSSMCWSEGSQVSLGNEESGFKRITDYECHLENITTFHLCPSSYVKEVESE